MCWWGHQPIFIKDNFTGVQSRLHCLALEHKQYEKHEVGKIWRLKSLSVVSCLKLTPASNSLLWDP